MKLAKGSEYPERIRFYGHLPQGSELAERYASALFATSPGYAGLSVIQAMAHGVPVLVSNGEPHSPEIEACVEGETTHFVAAATSDDWSDALRWAGENSSMWEKRRRSIAQFAEERYTFESMAGNFLGLLEEVAKIRKH